MKQQAIHTDIDGSVARVVFTGGNISVGGAIGTAEGRPAALVRFQQLESRRPVGLDLDPPEGTKMIGPELRLVFLYPASIDVVIEHLRFAKEKLEEELAREAKESVSERAGRRGRRAGEANP